MAGDDESDTDERRRRARAIWGYSLLAQDTLASNAGMTHDRLRAALGKGGRPSLDELEALASAVDGVPREFALNGFRADPLADLDHRLARIERIFGGANEALARVAIQRLLAAAGRVQAQRLEGPPRSEDEQGRDDRVQEGDDT